MDGPGRSELQDAIDIYVDVLRSSSPTQMAQATEVRIENIFRYANVYQTAIDLVDSGRLNLKPFITDTFAMKDAKAAFDRMDEGRPGDIKLQITVNRD